VHRTLILNLESEHARLAFQIEQAERLGLDWQRIPAVTPDTVEPAPSDPYWRTWERPLRTTEMAAMRTHQTAWRQVADSGTPALILEDDAILHDAVPDLLERLGNDDRLEHVTLETRGRRKLIAREPVAGLPIHRLWLDRSGAAAYYLRPSGATKLLAHTDRACGLSDALLCSTPSLRSWQAVPALAVQFDMAEQFGAPLPFPVASTIGAVSRPGGRTLGQLWRRGSRQLRMGLIQLRWGTRKLTPDYRSG
jgi:glycosyl transferase family 25